MSISDSLKKDLLFKYGKRENDTGSPEVQCALFTERIKILTSHLQKNKHDNGAKRGLISSVVKRRRLLRYLKKVDISRFEEIMKNLGLKKI